MFLTTSSSGTESNIKPSVSAMRQQVYTRCSQQGRATQSDPHNAVGILHVQSCLTHCWTSTSTALLRTLGEHGGTELLLHRGQGKKHANNRKRNYKQKEEEMKKQCKSLDICSTGAETLNTQLCFNRYLGVTGIPKKLGGAWDQSSATIELVTIRCKSESEPEKPLFYVCSNTQGIL